MLFAKSICRVNKFSWEEKAVRVPAGLLGFSMIYLLVFVCFFCTGYLAKARHIPECKLLTHTFPLAQWLKQNLPNELKKKKKRSWKSLFFIPWNNENILYHSSSLLWFPVMLRVLLCQKINGRLFIFRDNLRSQGPWAAGVVLPSTERQHRKRTNVTALYGAS